MSSSDQHHAINRCLRSAVDQTEEGILVLEGRITTPLGPRLLFANQAATRMTGYPLSTLAGQPLGMILDNTRLDAILEKLPVLDRSTPAFFVDAPLLSKEGETVPCRLIFSADLDTQDRIVSYSLIIRPVPFPAELSQPQSDATHFPEPEGESGASEEMSMEQVFEDSRSESLALAAGGVAHDFKNALQTIVASIDLARFHVPLTSPAIDHLDDADQALTRADALARQMLAFTKGQSSDLQKISLQHLLAHVTAISTLGTDVRASLNVAEDLGDVQADPNQISQVFHNIVLNACQAMEGGGTVKVTANNCSIPTNNALGLDGGRYVAVGIKDRGCGIPSENLERIFEPYFTTKTQGNGIGLAACREIIRQHRGHISVDSVVGSGTEFVVFLPVFETRESAPQGSDESEPEAGSVRTRPANRRDGVVSGSGCVLVVDDEELVGKTLESLLRHLGYTTLTARNGADAIDIYRYYADTSEPIDAVLLDLTLPGGMSGREVMKELRSVDADARIIATSGHFDENSVEEFLHEGCVGVLPKPFPIERLSQTVAEAIAN